MVYLETYDVPEQQNNTMQSISLFLWDVLTKAGTNFEPITLGVWLGVGGGGLGAGSGIL